MKQQFVITTRYTILQKTENTSPILNRATLKHVTSLLQYVDKPFPYGHEHFDRQFVCDANMLDGFVGYDKLPSHKRDYGRGSDHCERRRLTNW